MRCYRLVKARHALEAFTGAGARAFGGRWNRPATPMVYAAQSLALAALETVVHFSGEERGISFIAFALEVPDSCVRTLEPRELPPDWRSPVTPPSTQDLGSEWQRSRSSVALRVPSVLVPAEWCVLLNPEHPDTRRVTIDYPEPFAFDERLWKN
jgi:RES domain-containing protein